MQSMHRGSRRITACVHRMYHGSRTASGCHNKGLDAEAANKIAYASSVSVGLDVTLIPGQTEGRIRQLNHEEVEFSVSWQPSHFHVHVLHRTKRTNGHTPGGIWQTTCAH